LYSQQLIDFIILDKLVNRSVGGYGGLQSPSWSPMGSRSRSSNADPSNIMQIIDYILTVSGQPKIV